MRRLSHSLIYLSIRHKSKWRYDYLYPALSAVLAGSFILFGPVDINISGDRGLLDQANNLVGILVGFFIAALAAVATFDRPSMDEPMAGVPPTMPVREKGVSYSVPLSRRIFLSQLFGYLTVLSVVTYAAGSLAQVSEYNGKFLGSECTYSILRALFVYVYSFLVSNIAVNTLLGVFYLSYRIHDIGSRKIEGG